MRVFVKMQTTITSLSVMAGLDPAIQPPRPKTACLFGNQQFLDGRIKSGHDVAAKLIPESRQRTRILPPPSWGRESSHGLDVAAALGARRRHD